MVPWLSAYLAATWQILLELSPSLLAGLFIAGLMHVYLPTGYVHRGLSSPDLRSVMRASLIGVPLPLCSCGVIPAAIGLRNEGASKGAATAFMISTPQTGVDSILVSASFLGWPFALFKLGRRSSPGWSGGALVNRLTEPDPAPAAKSPGADGSRRALGMPGVLRYALFDLLGAIDLWLIAGILVAALISVLVPPDFFAGQPWSQGLVGMLLVLAISLPLYVCTTASVPIAASLIAAGMPAGSALVFLMAGPATNVATIGAVYRTLGGRCPGGLSGDRGLHEHRPRPDLRRTPPCQSPGCPAPCPWLPVLVERPRHPGPPGRSGLPDAAAPACPLVPRGDPPRGSHPQGGRHDLPPLRCQCQARPGRDRRGDRGEPGPRRRSGAHPR